MKVTTSLFNLALLLLILVEPWLRGGVVYRESDPELSLYTVIRFLLIFGLAIFSINTMGMWVSKSHQEHEIKEMGEHHTHKSLVLGFSMFAIFLALLYVFLPYSFFWLSREDRLIENLTFLALISAGCIILSKLYRDYKQLDSMPALYLLALGLACLAGGLEEVSWFQRVLNIETPELFSGNLQKETNLHNFASNQVEVALFTLASVLFVLMPFLKWTNLPLIPSLRPYFPSVNLVLFGGLMSAMNHDLWNIPITQLSFAVSVILVGGLKGQMRHATITLVAMVTVQATLILWPRNMDLMPSRNPATEYKEFYIALCFFLYSVEIRWNRAKGKLQ